MMTENAHPAPRELAPESRGCTDDVHRCEALSLAFFALWHTGDLDDATRAAIAQCNARRG